MATNKRLDKQFGDLEKAGFIVVRNEKSWQINLNGPQQSPFQGGVFAIEFKLDNFPFKAPIVKFTTKIFHPNIDKDGNICQDMLQIGQKWAPVKTLVSIMHKIVSLLRAPSVDNPMNLEAAQAYKNNTWQGRAKEQTLKYAKPN